ncbi:hypothetical protein Pedsa_2512 [Pseudopedobacter saltans DSM 12145]|uniref:ATP synthase protein I n=1 Tax=Pseudopedobacter saltans (strain ATCC 51119 / DSM 12145 / JCM 21818 / CCUG 39354 / LMG 10337 / NBRC 100064 / NCIMB 13643) TaxID=762903 RepID=F0S4N9_PSESL|nr:hypothetical protein Pedsa_2512 [Pseudopedobacter saltans DSM 12145]
MILGLSKFFSLFFVYTLLLVGVSLLLMYPFNLITYFIPKYWVIFGFMAGIAIVVYLVSWYGIKNGGEGQVLMSMGGIVIRLLLSMLLAVFYLNKFKVDPIIFVINFFSAYFLFTVFEIYCLLVNLRHQIKK